MTEQRDPMSDAHWLAAQDRRVEELEQALRRIAELESTPACDASLRARSLAREALGDA